MPPLTSSCLSDALAAVPAPITMRTVDVFPVSPPLSPSSGVRVIVATKDSWRDEDRDSEGAILEKILEDIRDQSKDLEEEDVETHFVKVRCYDSEDVVISGKRDETFKPRSDEGYMEWITINVEPVLSATRHLPSTGHIPESERRPAELARGGVRPRSVDIPRRVQARTVFEDVETPLMEVRSLEDGITCLSHSLQALYYMHKAGWVRHDLSVANVTWVGKNGCFIGKLTDFEYAKKVGAEVSHDVRTGTMHFMTVEVERQRYLFEPELTDADLFKNPDPTPFRMNFIHDLESHWWGAMWFLMYHADANSRPEDPEAQGLCFRDAFPGAIGQASRYQFFTMGGQRVQAVKALSTTYREKCLHISSLAGHLNQSYRRAEAQFPRLILDDNVMKDIHEQMLKGYSDTVVELKGSNIYLRPLSEVLRGRKRNTGTRAIDDSDGEES